MRTFVIVSVAVIICLGLVYAEVAASDKIEANPVTTNAVQTEEVSSLTKPDSTGKKVEEKNQEPGFKHSVQVHGHWTIEIRDTDGKTVSITEFDNGLSTTFGLTYMLGKYDHDYGSYGGWQIYLQGEPDSPCSGTTCKIAQNMFDCESVSEINSTNLTVSIEGSSGDEYIHLNGSVTANNSTSLDGVGTRVKVCHESILPSNCLTANSNCSYKDFTIHGLFPFISVQAGQQILVDVVIAFE